jgi:hypothetical protein
MKLKEKRMRYPRVQKNTNDIIIDGISVRKDLVKIKVQETEDESFSIYFIYSDTHERIGNNFINMPDLTGAVETAEFLAGDAGLTDDNIEFYKNSGQLIRKYIEERKITVNLNGIGEIDASFANIIRSLNDTGYRTVQCCSGCLADHIDNNRPQRLIGFIMFHSSLDEDRINRIIRATHSNGLSYERMALAYGNVLKVFLPFTCRDTSNTLSDKIRQIEEEMVSNGEEIIDYFITDTPNGKRIGEAVKMEIKDRAEKLLGGIIPLSDEQKMIRWNGLLQAL